MRQWPQGLTHKKNKVTLSVWTIASMQFDLARLLRRRQCVLVYVCVIGGGADVGGMGYCCMLKKMSLKCNQQ